MCRGRRVEEPGRPCKGRCKKYRALKPRSGGRYEAGQARCQICQIWVDHRGAHLKGRVPAEAGSMGWYCSCCGYRLRQNPRNKKYKAKFHASKSLADGRVEEAVRRIKSSRQGVYSGDMQRLFGASHDEMLALMEKVVRIEGIRKREIRLDGETLTVLEYRP